jgi:hypothetical protein
VGSTHTHKHQTVKVNGQRTVPTNQTSC